MACIGFSDAARVVQCPGSIELIENIGGEKPAKNEKQLEGIAAHWVASEAVHDRVCVAGDLSPNGVVITDEMIDGAAMYVTELRNHLNGQKINDEYPLACKKIHPDNYGVIDAWYYDVLNHTIRVWDYKFGHAYVDVYENWQLLNEACAVVDYIGRVDTDELRVEMCIVQPRSFHRDGPVRRWNIPVSELQPYRERMIWAYNEAKHVEAKGLRSMSTGPECSKCPAASKCELLLNTVMDITDNSCTTAPILLSPNELGKALSVVRKQLELLNAIDTAFTQEVTTLLEQSTTVPGWAMTQGRGTVKWNAPVDEVIAAGEALGIPLAKQAVITPLQALKKGLPDIMFEALAVTQPTKFTLTETRLERLFK